MCSTLRELGIQNAELTSEVIESLMDLKHLRVLDVEGTCFNDEMAEKVASSKRLEVLDIGATKITRAGLQHLVSMRRLRSLDLWATKLTEEDLALLVQMPNLAYLSVGNCDGLPSLDATRMVALLLSLPALKRVWLDGIALTAAQKDALQAKLETVRVTSFPPDEGNEAGQA